MIESCKVITRRNTERVARCTFEFARRNGRKHVTAIHKAARVIKTDGLFLETVQRISLEYPDIECREMDLKRSARYLVLHPCEFDVILTPSLYGSILSSIVSGVIGGYGLLPLRNYSDKYAIFEPAMSIEDPDLIQKNMVNPIAILNASVDMLEHLGFRQHAHIIERAIEKTICMDELQTPDIGGTSSTSDLIESIQNNMFCYTILNNLKIPF